MLSIINYNKNRFSSNSPKHRDRRSTTPRRLRMSQYMSRLHHEVQAVICHFDFIDKEYLQRSLLLLLRINLLDDGLEVIRRRWRCWNCKDLNYFSHISRCATSHFVVDEQSFLSAGSAPFENHYELNTVGSWCWPPNKAAANCTVRCTSTRRTTH